MPLDAIVASFADGTWERHLLPIDAALQALPAWRLDAEDVERIRHGQQIPRGVGAPPAHVGQPGGHEPLCRAYAPGGELVAILRHVTDADRWQPEKVFLSD